VTSEAITCHADTVTVTVKYTDRHTTSEAIACHADTVTDTVFTPVPTDT